MHSKELKKWIAQIRKGSLDLCILALINKQTQYSFELIQNLKKIDDLIVTEGTIYPLLNRLQSAGLIQSFWAESTSGPPRKYYSMTDKGKELLEQMIGEWNKFSRALDQILEWSQVDGSEGTENDQPIPIQVEKQPHSSSKV